MIKKYQKAFTLTEISLVILVIGILIAGISQAIEMFSEASLTSARNLSKSSRISRIDDLSLWLDATSDKAFDKEKDDGSTISMWKDTNPRSTAQIIGNPVSSNFPTYTLSAINGLPTASFKKTSSNCMTIPSQSFVNNSEDFTLYLIFNPKTLDDGIILEKNNATATNFPFSLELNSGFYKFSVKNSPTTLSVLGAKKANINNPNLIRLSRIKGSQIEIAINGVSSTQSDTLTSSTLNTTELAIGCRNGTSPANFINGDIGEIAFFDRNLSVKEKADIEEFFYKKWKIKKYEGVLANHESTCAVPSDINANPEVTFVQQTVNSQIDCAAGFIGSINYKCNNEVFSVLSNTCSAIKCLVPNDRNTIADGNEVSFTLSPLGLDCKSGYGGNFTYICDASGTFASSGTCTEACSLSGTITAYNYKEPQFKEFYYDEQGNLIQLNECDSSPQTFTMLSSDIETVIADSTWKTKNIHIPYYVPMKIRYNCSLINGVYTLRVEVKNGCIYNSKPYNHGECFIDNDGKKRLCVNFSTYPANSNCETTLLNYCETNWSLN